MCNFKRGFSILRKCGEGVFQKQKAEFWKSEIGNSHRHRQGGNQIWKKNSKRKRHFHGLLKGFSQSVNPLIRGVIHSLDVEIRLMN